MAVLKIVRMGHPVLTRPAKPVSDPSSPEIQRLIADMIETLKNERAVGLAAPQVHVPLRLVVFHVPPSRIADEEGAEPQPLTVLINPAVEPDGEERETQREACLSLPGLSGQVPRYKRVRYRGTAPDGAPIERTASGFHARVLQHECDHLDGILYLMRMDDLSTLSFDTEFGGMETL